MLLDLSRLRGGSEHVARELAPSSLGPANEDFRIVDPVALDIEVHKDGTKVRVTGRLMTRLECACSRCLEPMPLPIDAKLELLFLPAPTEGADGETEVADDDLGVSFYKDDVLDLGEMVREQLYLALPMKPLCREDCRGLCPVCGINRNAGTCDCQANWIDPRLEPLSRLKNQ